MRRLPGNRWRHAYEFNILHVRQYRFDADDYDIKIQMCAGVMNRNRAKQIGALVGRIFPCYAFCHYSIIIIIIIQHIIVVNVTTIRVGEWVNA